MRFTILVALMLLSERVACRDNYSLTPILFVENSGQITDQYLNPRSDIDFKLQANNLAVYFGGGHIHYQFTKSNQETQKENALPWLFDSTMVSTDIYRLDVELIGANKNVSAHALEKQTYTEQYVLSHINSNQLKASSFSKIVYGDIYPNIDWVLYIKEGKLKYDFVVKPGGNPQDIKLKFKGVAAAQVNSDGSFTALTPYGNITEHAPVCFQEDGQVVRSFFEWDDDILHFKTDPYVGTLTIDPSVSWTVSYGGSHDDVIHDIAYDKVNQSLYVTGYTRSTNNIATIGSFQTTLNGIQDAFLSKMDTAGNLIWCTYFGGANADAGYGLSYDNSGNVYLSGSTYSTGIGTSGAYQPFAGGAGDAFLAKFSDVGIRLWCSYYGGSQQDGGSRVVCDATGSIYVAGGTSSSNNIAGTNSHQPTFGGEFDCFVAKFTDAGTRLWGTYYGGNETDNSYSLKADNYGNLYLSGYTQSTTNIATPGCHQPTYSASDDGFLAKFDTSGVRQWATYYGGTGYDYMTDIACHNTDVFVVGKTYSNTGIATLSGYQSSYGNGGDAFIVKFNGQGVRNWGTYYGWIGSENAAAVACDSDFVYVFGTTFSNANIATPGGFQLSFGGIEDAFVTKFHNNGNFVWGSYYGDANYNVGRMIRTGNPGELYIGGYSEINSQFQGYVTKFHDCFAAPLPPLSISGPQPACLGDTVMYHSAPSLYATSYSWSLPTGWIGNSTGDSIVVVVGSNSGNISVSAENNCGMSASQTLFVTTSNPPPAIVTNYTPLVFCPGDEVKLYGNYGLDYTYQWQQNGSDILGATLPAYVATTSGSYTITISDGICSAISIPVIVVADNPQPAIQQSGTTLTTGTYSSYQWYFIGNILVNDTNQTIDSIQLGYYVVEVSDSTGCIGTSDTFFLNSLSAGDLAGENVLSLYPNPNDGQFNLVVDPNVLYGEVDLLISDLGGKHIQIQTLYLNRNRTSTQIFLDQNLQPGAYVLKLQNEKVCYATPLLIRK